MPFKSEAQHRKFRVLLEQGKISQAKFDEWMDETRKKTGNKDHPIKPLPERVKRASEEKPLYQPKPSTRPGKKYMVYVKGDSGDPKLIHFGATGYKHNYSEDAKKNFRARHNCDSAQKDSAKWWACNYLWNKKQNIGDKTYEKVAAQIREKGLLKVLKHNETNPLRKSVKITYKKKNGRTIKRKVDPLKLNNNLLVAFDHKRGALRSFRMDRMQSMEKSAFIKGFLKTAGGESMLYHAAEIGGLGMLAYPSIKKLTTGKDMNEHKYHKLETAGLGILAAPSALAIGKRIIKNKAFKKALLRT